MDGTIKKPLAQILLEEEREDSEKLLKDRSSRRIISRALHLQYGSQRILQHTGFIMHEKAVLVNCLLPKVSEIAVVLFRKIVCGAMLDIETRTSHNLYGSTVSPAAVSDRGTSTGG